MCHEDWREAQNCVPLNQGTITHASHPGFHFNLRFVEIEQLHFEAESGAWRDIRR